MSGPVLRVAGCPLYESQLPVDTRQYRAKIYRWRLLHAFAILFASWTNRRTSALRYRHVRKSPVRLWCGGVVKAHYFETVMIAFVFASM